MNKTRRNSSSEYVQIDIEEEMDKQKNQIRRQDGELEKLGKSIQVIKKIATNIDDELNEQEQSLILLNTDVEKSASKVDTANRKILRLTKQMGDQCCIGLCTVFLVIIVIVLFLLFLK